MADLSGTPRPPTRILALAGLSTATYALSLALVTSLQSAAETATIADREPLASAIDALANRNDRLAGQVDGLIRTGGERASDYRSATAAIADLESALGRLSKAVATVDGAARALPAAVALPPVVRSVRASSGSSRSTSHATSGGSAVR